MMRRSSFIAGTAAAGATVTAFPNIARAQTQTIRFGSTPTTSEGPFFVAERKGYWRDEGLTVEFGTYKSSGDMVVPFSQGTLDAGVGTPAAGLYNGVARGLTSRLVASCGIDATGYGCDRLLVRSDLVKSGRYATPRDLKGMTIAGTEPGSGSTAALYFLLQKYGLGWSDVHYQPLGFSLHVLALANGKVDAAYTAEPLATAAARAGSAVDVMGDDAWYPNQQITALLYSGDFMKKPDLALRFMRGYVRGARYYYGALKNGKFAGPNANDVIAILTELLPQERPSIYREITPIFVGPEPKLQLASMKRDLDYFRTQGLIESPTIGVNDIIDLSFLNRALKDVGPYKGSKA